MLRVTNSMVRVTNLTPPGSMVHITRCIPTVLDVANASTSCDCLRSVADTFFIVAPTQTQRHKLTHLKANFVKTRKSHLGLFHKLQKG
jgi:hypothetical protein